VTRAGQPKEKPMFQPRTRDFAQVDVFSATPYLGNPVAVVLEADGIPDADMARFARWTNLSETTFVLPPTSPEADYRLRIFTPSGELPFAGHPTLGSAHAWLEGGGTPRADDHLVQECAAGLVELRRDATLAFAAPPTLRSGPLDESDVSSAAEALRIPRERILDAQWVDNGPGWAAVRLRTAAEVLDLEPDFSRFPTAKLGVLGAYPDGADAAFEVRGFAPGVGVLEDPVTGSLNASIAQWLIGSGAAPRSYIASQGTRVGRRGRIEVRADDDGTVWVGGATTTCIRGTVTI
jgi:PhzF family phenazine biosynthesis protein